MDLQRFCIFQNTSYMEVHCKLDVSDIVKAAVSHLQSPFLFDIPYICANNDAVQAATKVSPLALRRHSYAVVKGILLSALRPSNNAFMGRSTFEKFFSDKLKVM